MTAALLFLERMLTSRYNANLNIFDTLFYTLTPLIHLYNTMYMWSANICYILCLGTEYRPISYYPATLGTVFSVIATAPAQVNVQLPIHAGNPEPADVIHPSDETTSVSAGSSFSVDLAEYESFQVRWHHYLKVLHCRLRGNDHITFKKHMYIIGSWPLGSTNRGIMTFKKHKS